MSFRIYAYIAHLLLYIVYAFCWALNILIIGILNSLSDHFDICVLSLGMGLSHTLSCLCFSYHFAPHYFLLEARHIEMEQHPVALALYGLILPFVGDKNFRQRRSLTREVRKCRNITFKAWLWLNTHTLYYSSTYEGNLLVKISWSYCECVQTPSPDYSPNVFLADSQFSPAIKHWCNLSVPEGLQFVVVLISFQFYRF